jgi:hypothetical protein
MLKIPKCSKNLIDFFSFDRFDFDISEETSFFSNRSPPSSPRPCPCSPSRDRSNLLSMDEDFLDLSSFIDKENKPYSPARKRLNLDAVPLMNHNTLKVLQPHSTNSLSPLRINSLKRSESSLESPVQSKRYKSENQPPASPTSTSLTFNSPAVNRKPTISIMHVLTSSSEFLRKNRL